MHGVEAAPAISVAILASALASWAYRLACWVADNPCGMR